MMARCSWSWLVLLAASSVAAQDEAPGAADLFPEALYAAADWGALYEADCRRLEEQPSSPYALYVLDRVAALRAHARDRAREVTALEAALAGKGVGGFMRDHYRRRLIGLLHMRGDRERARALAKDDGVVRSWAVSGPFGFDAGSLHDIELGPETVPWGEPMRGTAGEADWIPLELEFHGLQVNPRDRIDRNSPGCAYAVTHVKVAEPGDHALHFLAQGSFKAWVGGRLVADLDRTSVRAPAELAFPVRLEKGWNRVLVKLSNELASTWADAAWFSLRVTDLDGETAKGLEAKHAVDGPVAAAAAHGVTERLRMPLDRMVDRVDVEDVHAALACATSLMRGGMAPEGFEFLRRHLESTALVPRYVLARTIQNYEWWPEAVRGDRARKMLEAICSEHPDFVPAAIHLAGIDHDNDRSEKAVERLEALRKRVGANLAVENKLAEIYGGLGWNNDRLAALRAQLRIHPEFVPALRGLARWYRGRNNGTRADELERLVASVAGTPLAGLRRDFARAVRAGDLEGAAKILGQLESGGESASAMLAHRTELAVERWRAGDAAALDEAVKLLGARHEKAPNRAGNLLEAADLLVEAGREGEARALYKRVLAIDPGNRRAARFLAEHKAVHEALFAEFAVEPGPMIEEAREIEATYGDISSVYLIDHLVTVVEPDRTMYRETHQLVLLRDRRAIQEFGQINVPGEVILVRTILPDGTTLEPLGTSPFTMPGLVPGACVEMKYRDGGTLTTARPMNLGGFYFQDRKLASPFHLTRWVVSLPKGSDFEVDRRHFDEGHTVDERDDRVVHVFEKRLMGRVTPEPHMPSPEDLLPFVQIVAGDVNWPQLNQALRDEVAYATIPTPEVVRAVGRATAGAATDLERAMAIYDWVMKEIPSEDGTVWPDQTLLMKRGDRLALMMAMFNAADIEFDYAKVMSRRDASRPVVWRDVAAGSFDIPYLLVRPRGGDPVWVNGALRWGRFGLIPDELAGAPVYVTAPGCGRIDVLPGYESAPQETDTFKLSLLPDDRAVGAGVLELRGATGAAIKQMMKETNTRRQRLIVGNIIGRQFVGMSPQLAEFGFDGLEERARPLGVRAEFVVSGLVSKRGGASTLRPIIRPIMMTRMWVRGKADRIHDLVIPQRQSGNVSIEVDLGGRWRVTSLPAPVNVVGKAGRYSLVYRRTPRGVVGERSIDIRPCRISPGEYPDFVKFCRRIDEAESRRIPVREEPKGRE